MIALVEGVAMHVSENVGCLRELGERSHGKYFRTGDMLDKIDAMRCQRRLWLERSLHSLGRCS